MEISRQDSCLRWKKRICPGPISFLWSLFEAYRAPQIGPAVEMLLLGYSSQKTLSKLKSDTRACLFWPKPLPHFVRSTGRLGKLLLGDLGL
jgi:hypothetical protein